MTDAATPPLRVSRDGAVACLTLARPDTLNALNAELVEALRDAVLAAPSAGHWFGTDSLGRDVFAEVVWGSQQSIIVAVAASFIAIAIGTLLAMLGAYIPRLDAVISVLVDLMLSLPVLPLMILVAALVAAEVRRLAGVAVSTDASAPEHAARASAPVRAAAVTVRPPPRGLR